MTSHIRVWKEAKLVELQGLADEYPFIGIVTLKGLPANIISILRKRLQGEAVFKVAKTRVVLKALQGAKFDSSKITPSVVESVLVIFSKKNPFELYNFIKRNKGSASARIGDIADNDIVVQAGDSGLPPGPALTALKMAGLKVKVAGPTIEITDNKVVTKKGEEVTAPIADVLSKLNIKPMKVGMKIIGIYDKQEENFYLAESIDVDEEELFEKFVKAYQMAFNLAVNAEYFTEATTEAIVMKAVREAKALNTVIGSPEPVVEAPTESAEEVVAEIKKEASVESTEAPAESKEETPAEIKKEAPTEPKKEAPVASSPEPVVEASGEAK